VDREVRHLARALDCGGSDYILKPFDAIELEARVRVALRTKAMLDLLREQAHIDALTGLHNRAAFEDAMAAAYATLDRTGHGFALVMMDLDHFKSINDGYGHGIGDAVLREIGVGIKACCRPYDVACRVGGDEFTVVLGNTNGAGAKIVAGRIREAIRSVSVRSGSAHVRASCSAGVVSSHEMPERFEIRDIVEAADAALYRAKREGRDRIVTAPVG
jgi:two-component system cell cycle response regulator